MSKFRVFLYVCFVVCLILGFGVLVIGAAKSIANSYASTTYSFVGKLVNAEDQMSEYSSYDPTQGYVLVDEHFYLLHFQVQGKAELEIVRYLQTDPPSYLLKVGGMFLVVVQNGTYTLAPWGDEYFSNAVSVKLVQ